VKVLLDENIPVQLRNALDRHEIASVNDKAVGWKNISNGHLLSAMEGRFDLLITSDRNIYAQQNLAGRTIAILVLPTNRRNEVLAMAHRIAAVIDQMLAGQYAVLERNGALIVRSFSSSSDE
jgi:predicted nuclease of predicted toxin-antitoxin system